MNTRRSSFHAALPALALGLVLAAGAYAQMPPPPPPIGPNAPPNQPLPSLPPDVRVLPPGGGPVPQTAFQPATTTIFVDAAAKRHDISPLIYGITSATPTQLAALNVPLFAQTRGAGLTDFSAVRAGLPTRIFSADASPDTQLLRNRVTRLLWDPRYGNPSGPGVKVGGSAALIPRLKARLSAYPHGTKAGLVNYNWGAENAMGGATAQADVLGIYGREGLDIATRTAPDASTPVFGAMQMYRNYDGKKSAFGSISVSDSVPDPDTLSSFAAVRRSDGALTIMVINKSQAGPASVLLNLSHFAGANTAQVWQLAGTNKITPQPSMAITTGHISAIVPAQSVTLFVVNAG